jgi:hypothetical protein
VSFIHIIPSNPLFFPVAMVPYADMLNHYRPRETKWQFDDQVQVCSTIIDTLIHHIHHYTPLYSIIHHYTPLYSIYTLTTPIIMYTIYLVCHTSYAIGVHRSGPAANRPRRAGV